MRIIILLDKPAQHRPLAVRRPRLIFGYSIWAWLLGLTVMVATAAWGTLWPNSTNWALNLFVTLYIIGLLSGLIELLLFLRRILFGGIGLGINVVRFLCRRDNSAIVR